MGSLRCADIQTRPTAVLDLTSLTIEESQRLVPPVRSRARRIWRPSAWMGSAAPPGATRPISIVRCARHHFRVRLTPWQPMV